MDHVYCSNARLMCASESRCPIVILFSASAVHARMLSERPHRAQQMQRWEKPGDVRFVTFSCQRRLPLLMEPLVADLLLSTLGSARAARGFELFAYVVMPEHVHLLLRPAAGDTVAAILKSVKLGVAQSVLAGWKKRGDPWLTEIATANGPRFWQKGGGFDRNVRSMTELTGEVLYTHQNPVERGLVGSATQWRWSSVHRWLARHCGEPCDAGPEIDPLPGQDRWCWEAWRGFMDWPENQHG